MGIRQDVSGLPSECLDDIHLLFGSGTDVTLMEEGAPAWPLRRATAER